MKLGWKPPPSKPKLHLFVGRSSPPFRKYASTTKEASPLQNIVDKVKQLSKPAVYDLGPNRAKIGLVLSTVVFPSTARRAKAHEERYIKIFQKSLAQSNQNGPEDISSAEEDSQITDLTAPTLASEQLETTELEQLVAPTSQTSALRTKKKDVELSRFASFRSASVNLDYVDIGDTQDVHQEKQNLQQEIANVTEGTQEPPIIPTEELSSHLQILHTSLTTYTPPSSTSFEIPDQFGIVTKNLKNHGIEQPGPVGTFAYVSQGIPNWDTKGTFSILFRGGRRFKVLQCSRNMYGIWEALVEFFDEDPLSDAERFKAKVLAQDIFVVLQNLAKLQKPADIFHHPVNWVIGCLPHPSNPVDFSFVLADEMILPQTMKEGLLTMTSTVERLEKLSQIVKDKYRTAVGNVVEQFVMNVPSNK